MEWNSVRSTHIALGMAKLQLQIFIQRHGFTDFLTDLCNLDLLRLVGTKEKESHQSNFKSFKFGMFL